MEYKGPHWTPGKTFEESIQKLNRITLNGVPDFGIDTLIYKGKADLEVKSGSRFRHGEIKITYHNNKTEKFRRTLDSGSVFYEEINEMLVANNLYLANASLQSTSTTGIKYMGICDYVISSIKLSGDIYKEILNLKLNEANNKP